MRHSYQTFSLEEFTAAVERSKRRERRRRFVYGIIAAMVAVGVAFLAIAR